ncbi:SpoIIE family protein phosphatase [Paracrocinitomix mangrovi]|uniref:SpoIIE family protein phosphatase n=1 Tax=Paracrocinitomix mangrovi TaxID=2862509 RepID=UPI001C8E6AC9|nr:SpoIIE family protein phosphatase [Paracrocinitomix mangrovi]UKN03655.1 SpoIIE family protein phosphatase [Paracrocinitomix mangrovi]
MIGTVSFGQSPTDSLLNLLEKDIADTVRLDALINLGWDTVTPNPEQALVYADQAEPIALKVKDPFRSDKVYRLKAFAYGNMNNRPKCLENHLKRVEVLEATNEQSISLAAAYYETAAVLKSQEQFDAAIDYFEKCGQTSKELGNKAIYGQSLMPLSEVKLIQGDTAGAKADLLLARDLCIEDRPFVAAIALADYASACIAQDSLDKAESALNEALVLIQEAPSEEYKGFVYQGMGYLWESRNEKRKALFWYNKARTCWEEENKYFYLQGLYLALAKNYTGVKADSANYFYEKHIELRDQVNTEDNNQQIAEMEARFQNAQKEKEIAVLSKEKEIADLETKRQSQINIIAFSGLGVVLVLLLFIVSRMRLIRKQNSLIEKQKEEVTLQKEIIEEKSKEMMDSIMYAKRIQGAAMPDENLVKSVFKDSFVIYLPKDQLSGDFYWMAEKENKGILSVGDCTGHGVPGALLSILGINYLNMGRLGGNMESPANMLNFLNNGIHSTFSSSEGEIRDGMDIAVASVDFSSLLMTYSCAKNPIYVFRNDELITLKGDRHAIGKSTSETEPIPFTNQEFQLQKDDVLYLFSDGFADQFGGDKGKKLGYKSFKKILLESHQLPMTTQKNKLINTLETWKGELEQLDDVCLIGLRV